MPAVPVTVFENDGLRSWTLPEAGGEVLIVCCARRCTPRPDVIEGSGRGRDCRGRLTRPGDLVARRAVSPAPISQAMPPAFPQGVPPSTRPTNQRIMLRIRYANAAAAIRSGAGWHNRRTSAASHMESYGWSRSAWLIPGGGGLTYIAPRRRERSPVHRQGLAAVLTEGFPPPLRDGLASAPVPSRANFATCSKDLRRRTPRRTAVTWP